MKYFFNCGLIRQAENELERAGDKLEEASNQAKEWHGMEWTGTSNS